MVLSVWGGGLGYIQNLTLGAGGLDGSVVSAQGLGSVAPFFVGLRQGLGHRAGVRLGLI